MLGDQSRHQFIELCVGMVGLCIFLASSSACVLDWSKQGRNLEADSSVTDGSDLTGDGSQTFDAGGEDDGGALEKCPAGWMRASAGEPCVEIDACMIGHGGSDENATCIPNMTPSPTSTRTVISHLRTRSPCPKEPNEGSGIAIMCRSARS